LGADTKPYKARFFKQAEKLYWAKKENKKLAN
jgi:hypothetical protein